MAIKETLAALGNLTAMQLKEKMNFSFKRNLKKTLFSMSFTVIGFVVATVICYFLIFFAKKMAIFDFNGLFPNNVLVFFFTIMFLLSVIFTTIGLMQSLYFSKDNFVLLTLPTTPSIVFLSKLLVHYVYELKKNLMFLIPLFIAFGISGNYPVYYYIWVVFIFFLITILPVLIGAVLSIPVMFFYQWIRKIKVLKYMFSAMFIGGIVGLAAYLISLIPADINLIKTWGTTFFILKHFLEQFDKAVLPLSLLVELMVGKQFSANMFSLDSVWQFFALIGSIVVLGTLCFVLAKPLFYSMASKPFEYKKNMKAKIRMERRLPLFLAVIKKEWTLSFRDSSFALVIAQLWIIMPLAIALLNSLYNAMNTRYLGTQLTVFFNIFIMLLFMLSANIRMASAYSRDGSSAYLNKLQPSACGKLLFAKLTVNLFVGAIGLIETIIVYSLYHALTTELLVYFAITAYFVYVAHLFGSAQMDIMNPQTEQYVTFASQSNNPNENKSSILVFVLAALFAGVWFALSLENVNTAWLKVMLMAIVYAGIKIYFYFLKIKVYYTEK